MEGLARVNSKSDFERLAGKRHVRALIFIT